MEAPQIGRSALDTRILNATALVGALVMLGSFTMFLAGVRNGGGAIALAIASSVMTGASASLSIRISALTVPPRTIPAAKPRPVEATPRPTVVPFDRLHPLRTVRSVQLPLACLLAAVAPWLLDGAAFDPAEQALLYRILLSAATLSIAVLLAIAAYLANRAEPTEEGHRQRGIALDLVTTWTLAAGIATWTGAANDPFWGVLAASVCLIATAALAGQIEEDSYANGAGPVALVLVGASAGVVAAIVAGAAPSAAGIVGVLAALAVPAPANLRGRRRRFPPGSIEFLTLAAGVVLGMITEWVWLAAGVVLFAAAATYSWRYPARLPVGVWIVVDRRPQVAVEADRDVNINRMVLGGLFAATIIAAAAVSISSGAVSLP
jgi:hypothetical protein